MQTEGIDEAADSPAVSFTDRKDLRGTSRKGAGKKHVWIGNRKNDADRLTAEMLRACLRRILRIFADPEFCAIYGEADDGSSAWIVVAVSLGGSER